MKYTIKEKEPVNRSINHSPAKAVKSVLDMAWSEFRAEGHSDEEVFHFLNGLCTTVNLSHVNGR